MSQLMFDISMSVDGFVAGPNPRTEAPLGDGGERLTSGRTAWKPFAHATT